MGKTLIKALLMIIFMPIYWILTLLVMSASVITGVVSVVTKFIGFFFILFGLWWVFVDKTYTSGGVAVGIGVACYIVPFLITNVLASVQSFFGGFIEALQES